MLYGAQKRLTEGCFFSTDSQSPPAENYCYVNLKLTGIVVLI